MEEKIEDISDISGLEMIAQGITAEVYLYEEGKILKLFRQEMPSYPVFQEYQKSADIHQRFRNTPQVYGLVRCKERYGIVYERIMGNDMIKEVTRKFYKIKSNSKLLALIHSELHSTELEVGYSVKQKLSEEIDRAQELSDKEKDRIKEYLAQLPDGRSLCHFDFHPGNIIMQNDRPVVIDWMTACTGKPEADVARTWLLFQFGEVQHADWFTQKVIQTFQSYMGKIYLEEYKRITGKTDHDCQKWLLPIGAARLSEWVSDTERKKLLELVRSKLVLL